ncbi:hypothetical protein [Trichlorobacter ammonificans]|uniref:Lipoprotein n=1 Tax=Trichlorobacter ammonificans TaxID=2916410 RepID=A0ABM9D8R7_9BACT|nr:hypothetical protein [Trichlorobacter ammonificans]CAH2030956.1 conserved protein of unknown function [Trichlorobacter ammonificans]
MFSAALKSFGYVALGALMLALAGCASSDILLKPAYQPVGTAAGKGGVVVLAAQLDEGRADARVQWILGEVRDSGGKIKGNVVSDTSPLVLVRNALQQELLRAGYTVQVVDALPKGVARGVVLNGIVMKLDELSSLVKSEADCRISFAVEVWKDGIRTNTLSFESRSTDFAVKDREKLHYEVMQKALGSAFSRAVPALVDQLGK